MDWIKDFNKAICYIEDNITEPLEYERIAREMNISSFYFQKIFSILCGYTVGEYIRNRRLTLAGSELMNTDAKIIDIALKYGYDTPEGFTRAFTRFHGVTPTAARRGNVSLRQFTRLSVIITLKGGDNMSSKNECEVKSNLSYKIEHKSAFSIIAKTQRFTKLNDVSGREDIPQFWNECHKDGTVKRLEGICKKDGVLRGNIVGLCMEDSTVVKDFPYSIGAEYGGGDVPEGYIVYEIPEATWVMFDSTGSMPTAIQELWHRIFTEFFPSSDYKPSGNFDIELYTSENMSGDDYHSEIWVAVERK